MLEMVRESLLEGASSGNSLFSKKECLFFLAILKIYL